MPYTHSTVSTSGLTDASQKQPLGRAGVMPLLQSFWVFGIAGLIFSHATSFGATLNGVSFVPGNDGQLEIQLNVDGEARQVTPKEQSNDGVYSLNLNADVSPALQSNSVIVDPTGEYVGRVERRGTNVSVVVPGVNSKNVRGGCGSLTL
jgi:hypothetical protein